MASTAVAIPQSTSDRNPKPPDPSTTTDTRLTFAALVAKPKTTARFSELVLPSRQYGVKEGVPSVNFTAAEYQAAAKRFDNTLIAKFQAGRPTLHEIRKFMMDNWLLTGRCTISSCWDDRHIIIILDNEDDVRTALTHPHRKVGHTYFRLFRWEAGYNPKKEIPKTTKWIRLPGLPIELFDRAIIRSIVSAFADFLDIDEKTKELSALSYARACVEFDVTQHIPCKIWINLPGERGFFQEVVVEGGLTYCQKCKMHGHDIGTCRKGQSLPKPDIIKPIHHKTPVNVTKSIANKPAAPSTLLGEWKLFTKKKAFRFQRTHIETTKDGEVPKEQNSQDTTLNEHRDSLPNLDAVLSKNSEPPPQEVQDSGHDTVTETNLPLVTNDSAQENSNHGSINAPILDSSVMVPTPQQMSNIKSVEWAGSYSLQNCINCTSLSTNKDDPRQCADHTESHHTIDMEHTCPSSVEHYRDASEIQPQEGTVDDPFSKIPHV